MPAKWCLCFLFVPASACWAFAAEEKENPAVEHSWKIGADVINSTDALPENSYPGGLPATPTEDLPKLTQIVRGGDWNERIHAVHELGAMGEPAIGALDQALDDPDWQVRFTAVHFLGRIGAPAIEPLERALVEDPCRVVRISALHWMGAMGEAGRKAVQEALKDESGVMRLYADYWLRKDEELPRLNPVPAVNPEEDLNVCTSSLTPGFKKKRLAGGEVKIEEGRKASGESKRK